eukprot:COSAG02_NODE_59407_length_274_cov_0.874286_1_plen_32_part_10
MDLGSLTDGYYYNSSTSMDDVGMGSHKMTESI